MCSDGSFGVGGLSGRFWKWIFDWICFECGNDRLESKRSFAHSKHARYGRPTRIVNI